MEDDRLWWYGSGGGGGGGGGGGICDIQSKELAVYIVQLAACHSSLPV